MNFYENLIILDSNLDSKAIEEAVERIKDVILKKGGEVLKTENWGRKKLAYGLKKRKEGIYVLLLFKAPSQTILELEGFYKVFEPLIKFLFIKLKRKQIDAVLPPAPAQGADSNKAVEPVSSTVNEAAKGE